MIEDDRLFDVVKRLVTMLEELAIRLPAIGAVLSEEAAAYLAEHLRRIATEAESISRDLSKLVD